MSTVTSAPSGKDPDEQLTLKELCKELKISRSTFYDWRQKQQAPTCHTLPNGQLRIIRRDFEMWLRARKDAS